MVEHPYGLLIYKHNASLTREQGDMCGPEKLLRQQEIQGDLLASIFISNCGRTATPWIQNNLLILEMKR